MNCEASAVLIITRLNVEPTFASASVSVKAYSLLCCLVVSDCLGFPMLIRSVLVLPTTMLYWHGNLLCHSSTFLLSCFKASQPPGLCGPLVGNAVRKKTLYLTFVVYAGVQWILSWVAATYGAW